MKDVHLIVNSMWLVGSFLTNNIFDRGIMVFTGALLTILSTIDYMRSRK